MSPTYRLAIASFLLGALPACEGTGRNPVVASAAVPAGQLATGATIPPEAAALAASLGRVVGPGERSVLSAAATAAPGARRLSGVEVRRIVFGNTLLRQAEGGTVTQIYIGRDGQQSLRMTNAAGQSATDRGSASLDGDRVCSRWERIAQGRPLCFAYLLDGASVIMVDLSGQTQPTAFQLRPGAPPA